MTRAEAGVGWFLSGLLIGGLLVAIFALVGVLP